MILIYKHPEDWRVLALILTLGYSSAASATLTLTDNGLGVYDSGINATWTQDANLLGTLEANAISQYGNDSSLISDIMSANGGVIIDTKSAYDNGTYHLLSSDFGTGGSVDWWGAQAFITYLNSINYGNSNQWALPSQPDQSSGYNVKNSQLGELFYNELGGTAGGALPVNSLFTNEQPYVYWTGKEYAPYPYQAWNFYIGSSNPVGSGYQYYSIKYSQYYAWAVSPGNVSAVPVPGAVWLFTSALAGLIGYNRRKSKQ